jgi:hypothetical protein
MVYSYLRWALMAHRVQSKLLPSTYLCRLTLHCFIVIREPTQAPYVQSPVYYTRTLRANYDTPEIKDLNKL